MVEKVSKKPGTRIYPDANGKWEDHSDIFGIPYQDRRAARAKEAPTLHLPDFTTGDLFYLGHLLISRPGLEMLEYFQAPVDHQTIDDLESFVNSVKGVDLKDYFNPKKEMNNIARKVESFAKMPMDARQAVLEIDPIAELVLGPLSHLSSEDLGFWHRIIHLDMRDPITY